MDKEEFQKKYDNSILVCCTENSIKKVFNICDLMDLTSSKSKQITAILIGEQTAKSPLFHVEQFLNDFYKEMEEEKKEVKMFEQRMNNAIYKLKQKYKSTYITKGTDMNTVIQCITELLYIIGERGVMSCVRHSARQLITDLMSGMIDVLNDFINKKIMIETDNTYQKHEILNEVYFYVSNVTAMQIYWGKNKDTLTISLLPEVERVRLDDDELEVFRKAFHILHKCNEWVMEDNKKQSKEPTFNKGNKIMYTIKDGNGNTYPVRRLSERVYESKEHKTLFITDEEGTVTGIYKEK